MLQPLHDRLDELRRRLRRAGVIRGTALLVIAILAGVAVAGAVDVWTRSSSTPFRLLLTVAALAPAVWTVVTALLPPLKAKLSDVELAQRVERRDPAWAGRLSAAAAFQNLAPETGSPALQRHLTSSVDRRLLLETLPDLVDRRKIAWPVLTALGVFLLAGVGVALWPTQTGTALSRLALPLAAIDWPREVDLVLWSEAGEPLGEQIQIGRGQTLRFLVRNRHGSVPDDLSLQIVAPDGRRRTESIPIVEEPGDDETSRSVGQGILLAEEGPLRFRAVGGDHHDMPFVTAAVVPPPVFEQIQVTITPPDYLNAEPVRPPEGIGSINGVVGSSVHFQARTNKPLASAELRVGDRPGPDVALSKDGRSVTATFTLNEPGFSSYWFRLQDRSGFENPQAPRYELRATADAVPEVSIVEPPDDLTATPEADLPVVVEAADDHGLLAVRLRFAPGRISPEGSTGAFADGQVIPLYSGPDQPTAGSFPLVWSLETLQLTPGDQVVFHGEATDAFNLGQPHVGTSPARTVTIVSGQEKRQEVLDKQAELLDGLVQTRREETRLRNAVESLLTQWSSAGELRREDRDRLTQLELEQRRISSRLVDAQQSLQAQAVRAQAQLAINRIDDDELTTRLKRIAEELEALRSDALPAADRDLTAARKAVNDEGTRALAGAKANLDTILASLDALLQNLGAWRDRRDLDSELSDLLQVQQELAESTAETAGQTLGTPAGQLTDEQTATLRQLGLRQHGLADRLKRFEDTVEQVAGGRESSPDETAAPDDPSTNAPPGDPGVKDVSDRLKKAGLPAMARAAGDSIRTNDLGEAGRLQQELANQLRELRQTLSQSGNDQNTTSLEAAAERLDELAAAQQDVVETLRKTREANEILPDEQRESLMRRQAELREAASTAARQLRETGARDAAQAAGTAAKRMSDGLERLRRRDDETAETSLQQALEELQQARRSTRDEVARLSKQLAEELIASSREEIVALAEQQAGVNDEVDRLESLRIEQGRRTRSQLLTLRQTAEAQHTVLESTSALSDKLSVAPAVAFALRSAADRMRLLHNALLRQQTDEDAQRQGAAARQRLEQIAAALQTDSEEPDQQPSQDDPGDPASEERGPPGELIPLAAQLRLLKEMQEVLLRDTESLDRRDAEEKQSELIQEWIEQTSRYQSRLAESVRALLDEASPSSGLEPDGTETGRPQGDPQ